VVAACEEVILAVSADQLDGAGCVKVTITQVSVIIPPRGGKITCTQPSHTSIQKSGTQPTKTSVQPTITQSNLTVSTPATVPTSVAPLNPTAPTFASVPKSTSLYVDASKTVLLQTVSYKH